MDNKTVAAIAVSTLLLGCGVSGLLFVKPAWDEQQQLKLTQANLTSEEKLKAEEAAVLRTKLNSMAMSTISYFDLSRSDNKKKELETKTVETLASITEPAVGASTCASGSHVCNGNRGTFTAKATKKARNRSNCSV